MKYGHIDCAMCVALSLSLSGIVWIVESIAIHDIRCGIILISSTIQCRNDWDPVHITAFCRLKNDDCITWIMRCISMRSTCFGWMAVRGLRQSLYATHLLYCFASILSTPMNEMLRSIDIIYFHFVAMWNEICVNFPECVRMRGACKYHFRPFKCG